jgi:hypothetical protein
MGLKRFLLLFIWRESIAESRTLNRRHPFVTGLGSLGGRVEGFGKGHWRGFAGKREDDL